MATLSRAHVRLAIAALVVLLVWFAVRGLANPTDHDIDQYLGGAMVAGDGRLYADVPHLQPPLQAWLLAPLVELFAPNAFLTLHLVTIFCGLAIVAIVARTARALGAAPPAALAAALLMALAEPFQYGVTTLRNDALPALLGAAAMATCVAAVATGRSVLAVATGMLWGLAASGKLFHLVVAGAGGGTLLLLAWQGRVAWRLPVAAMAGGMVGLLPMLVGAWSDPDAFRWGVFEFAATAPDAWNAVNGRGERMTLPHKLWTMLRVLAEGPALVAILLCLDRWRRRDAPYRAEHVLLDALVVGGLVAAMLPTPVQRGYFLPALAPLFVRLAPLVECAWRERRRVPLALLAIGAVSGLVRLPVLVALAEQRGWPAPAVSIEAGWIGDRLRAAGAAGAIATLSPRLVLDSGYPLDRRFATGVFVFRTGWLLSRAEAHAFDVATPATLAEAFARHPPAAIVTGYEDGRARFPMAPDAAMADYARDRGWIERDSPVGDAVLFINPSATKAHRQ